MGRRSRRPTEGRTDRNGPEFDADRDTAESLPGETRVAATPQTVGQLIKARLHGRGRVRRRGRRASDSAFADAGAEIGAPWSADVVLKVNAPDAGEIAALRDGATLISLISRR